jgi:hypothetical protein
VWLRNVRPEQLVFTGRAGDAIRDCVATGAYTKVVVNGYPPGSLVIGDFVVSEKKAPLVVLFFAKPKHLPTEKEDKGGKVGSNDAKMQWKRYLPAF